MAFKGTRLSLKTQSRKVPYCMTAFIEYSGNHQIMEMKNIARGCGCASLGVASTEQHEGACGNGTVLNTEGEGSVT